MTLTSPVRDLVPGQLNRSSANELGSSRVVEDGADIVVVLVTVAVVIAALVLLNRLPRR